MLRGQGKKSAAPRIPYSTIGADPTFLNNPVVLAEKHRAKMVVLQYWLQRFESFEPEETSPKCRPSLKKSAKEDNENLQTVFPEAGFGTWTEVLHSTNMSSAIDSQITNASTSVPFSAVATSTETKQQSGLIINVRSPSCSEEDEVARKKARTEDG